MNYRQRVDWIVFATGSVTLLIGLGAWFGIGYVVAMMGGWL